MKLYLFGAIIAASAFISAQASATTIDFTDLPIGEISSPITYPTATFSSDTGEILVGAAQLAHEICPLSGFNCEATLTVDFTNPANGLNFVASGYDAASTLSVSGTDASGAFSTTVVNSGTSPLGIDLSSFAGIKTLSLTNDDPSGLAYDFFSFNSGAPEPASWALMLLGLGLIGGMQRRRARAVVC